VALAAPGVLIPVLPETAPTDAVEGRRSGDQGALEPAEQLGDVVSYRGRWVAQSCCSGLLVRRNGAAPESAAASGRWASCRLSPAPPVRADSTSTLQAISAHVIRLRAVERAGQRSCSHRALCLGEPAVADVSTVAELSALRKPADRTTSGSSVPMYLSRCFGPPDCDRRGPDARIAKSAREEDLRLASVEERPRLLLGLRSAHVSGAVPESSARSIIGVAEERGQRVSNRWLKPLLRANRDSREAP